MPSHDQLVDSICHEIQGAVAAAATTAGATLSQRCLDLLLDRYRATIRWKLSLVPPGSNPADKWDADKTNVLRVATLIGATAAAVAAFDKPSTKEIDGAILPKHVLPFVENLCRSQFRGCWCDYC